MKTVTVGCCIYCQRADVSLSREHIIPYGLNGEWILQQASCASCSKVTSQIEEDVLRNMLSAPRTIFKMRSYRPKKRKKTLPLQVEKHGKRHIIQIPVEDYPIYMAMPLFAPPAHLSGKPYSSGIVIRKETKRNVVHVGGATFLQLKEKYKFDYDYLGVRIEYEPVNFARMLAKIGFGMTVFAAGLPSIAENYVLPAIMGDTQDIGRWVGSEDSAPVNPTHGLHAVSIFAYGDEIHAKIRLFAQAHQNEYLVVVGKYHGEIIHRREKELSLLLLLKQ